ncbi:MAG: MBL fold metallo-hydrolase [Mariniblastus sp.]
MRTRSVFTSVFRSQLQSVATHIGAQLLIVFSIALPITGGISASAAQDNSAQEKTIPEGFKKQGVELVVLGIAQDAGFPQAGCAKSCCAAAWKDKSLRRLVASVAVVDHASKQRWLLDCSPDFPDQLRMLDDVCDAKKTPGLDGIFLTHAHIGHYSGLIHLGREAMGSKQIPTHVMPRMKHFLENNGPWSQLVKLKNIELKEMKNEVAIKLNDRISITPFLVPHRDEFSETVGFKIAGPNKSVVFLPDIDKWSRWDGSVEKLIEGADIAYLDGTFFENGEIPGRDMSLIPHPFVAESINRFATLDETERKKVRFIHFNHTNPILQLKSRASESIKRAGMAIAEQGEVVEL